MEEMIKLFKALENLADRWKEYSLKVNGWETQEYYNYEEGMKVRCYFSNEKDHINIEIEGISIAYFSPKKFGGLTYSKLRRLKDIITEYSNWLNELETEYIKKTQEELKKEKQIKIHYYEERLKELKEALNE